MTPDQLAAMPEVTSPDTRLTGFSFCNLCETNVAACDTPEKFLRAVRAAALIGTLQATYTDFPYLGPITEAICRAEALLGVGLTGIMDNPAIGLNPALLQQAADVAVETNREWAEKLGIRQAARITTVKPSGTASLELGCVGSGIHPHHAPRYFRRITANKLEPIAQYLHAVNPHMFQTKPNGDWCITFPVAAPETATKFVKNQTSQEFLDAVFLVYENWIKPGTVRPESAAITHNVSATVTAWEHEWDYVKRRLWDEREKYNAISFAHAGSDKGIPYMPREEVMTDADWALWEELITKYVPVDYTQLVEEEDLTAANAEAACAGGACEIDLGSGVARKVGKPGCVMLFLDDMAPDDEAWFRLNIGGPLSWEDTRGGVWNVERGAKLEKTATGRGYVWGKYVRQQKALPEEEL
jgi:ribonucleoside-diphosphate reductase alpha chain